MIFWKYYDGAKSVFSNLLLETQWKQCAFVFRIISSLLFIYFFITAKPIITAENIFTIKGSLKMRFIPPPHHYSGEVFCCKGKNRMLLLALLSRLTKPSRLRAERVVIIVPAFIFSIHNAALSIAEQHL